jgi:gamma-glutamyltranspeptidase / glutathione hydrolase
MSLPEAINAPRVHHQALPDSLTYERDYPLSPEVLDSLRGLGYPLRTIGNIASVNGILRTNGGWVGYSDPRSGGKSAGY